MRRRSTQRSNLKRSMDWAGYSTLGSTLSVDDADPSVFSTDWMKLPAGIPDSLSGDLEPVDDTWTKLLAWGGGNLSAAGATQTIFFEAAMGILEWQGIDEAVAPQGTPLPLEEAGTEWIWVYREGGYTTVPNGLSTSVSAVSDWQRVSKAKRKLPELMGVAIVFQFRILAFGSAPGTIITWYPNHFFRYLIQSSRVKARR